MKNSLKQRFYEGDYINIIRIPMNSTSDDVKEVIIDKKPDMIYIDCQHSPYSEWDIMRICDAAQAFGVGVQLRIKHTEEVYKCGNMCDLGLLSIKVPEIRKLKHVETAIQSFYFPPFGARSWGGNVGYNPGRIGYNDNNEIEMFKYAKWWNKNGILGFKIENIEAVLNIRQLVIKGIDYVDFGPCDLMFDIKNVMNPSFNTVDECKKYVQNELRDVDVRVFT